MQYQVFVTDNTGAESGPFIVEAKSKGAAEHKGRQYFKRQAIEGTWPIAARAEVETHEA